MPTPTSPEPGRGREPAPRESSHDPRPIRDREVELQRGADAEAAREADLDDTDAVAETPAVAVPGAEVMIERRRTPRAEPRNGLATAATGGGMSMAFWVVGIIVVIGLLAWLLGLFG